MCDKSKLTQVVVFRDEQGRTFNSESEYIQWCEINRKDNLIQTIRNKAFELFGDSRSHYGGEALYMNYLLEKMSISTLVNINQDLVIPTHKSKSWTGR
jgi:hypothetical protein